MAAKDTSTAVDPTAVIDGLRRTWGSTFVPRPKFGEFSKGLYSPGHMANRDSAGTGPTDSFFLGKTRCYPIDSAIAWLKQQIRSNAQDNVRRAER